MDKTPEEAVKDIMDEADSIASIFKTVSAVKGVLYADWLKNIYNLAICNVIYSTYLLTSGQKQHVELLTPQIEVNTAEIIQKAVDHISNHTGRPVGQVKEDFGKDMVMLLERAATTNIYPIVRKGSSDETDSTGRRSPDSGSPG